ncbi:MAG: hypothetical protein JNM94_07415 [Phycisphaerae bacterium]|nr:hypothetical protein [Phycisphaerae bacterium]
MTSGRFDDGPEDEPAPFLDRAVIAACMVGIAMLGFLWLGRLVCAAESAEVIPPGLWTMAIAFVLPMAIVAFIVALGVDFLLWARFERGPEARWRDKRCPQCGHKKPPRMAASVCAECGAALQRPKQPRSPLVRLSVGLLVAAIFGGFGSLFWLGIDVYRFRLDVAMDPAQSLARPRAWPFDSAGLTYSRVDGFAAND